MKIHNDEVPEAAVEFFTDLKALLEKHDVTVEIYNRPDSYGEEPVLNFSNRGKWDSEGNCVVQPFDFESPIDSIDHDDIHP